MDEIIRSTRTDSTADSSVSSIDIALPLSPADHPRVGVLADAARLTAVIAGFVVLVFLRLVIFPDNRLLYAVAALIALAGGGLSAVAWAQVRREQVEQAMTIYNAAFLLVLLPVALLGGPALLSLTALALVVPPVMVGMLFGYRQMPVTVAVSVAFYLMVWYIHANPAIPAADLPPFLQLGATIFLMMVVVRTVRVGLLRVVGADAQRNIDRRRINALQRRVETLASGQAAFARAAVDIIHLGTLVTEENTLLEAVTDLLHLKFDLAAVQIFLVDIHGLFGELRIHVGSGDSQVIQQTPGVRVGAGTELGEVLAGGQGRVLANLSSLPRSAVPSRGVARSGMLLPMLVDGRSLGAMVLYGRQETSLLAADVATYGSVADTFALMLDNVRRRESGELGRVRSKLEVLGGGATAQREGQVVSVNYRSGGDDVATGATHSTDIRMGDQVVGSMTFKERVERPLDPDEIELIESVADQVAQAIDNLNLLEGVQSMALREQLINDITAQLQRASSVDEVLKTAARAVRNALGNVEVVARLETDSSLARSTSAEPPVEV